MNTNRASSDTLPPAAMRSLAKEVKDLMANPPAGITIALQNDNCMVLLVDIEGPPGTPYEDGVFSFRFHLIDYPAAPPKGVCLTKIFHPNINPQNGDICVSVLKKDWTPTVGLKQLFLIIKCLLISPNPESALCEEAGKLLLEDYEQYAKQARMMTHVHAKKTTPGTAPVVTNVLSQTNVLSAKSTTLIKPLAAANKPSGSVLPKPVIKPAAKPAPQPIASNAAKKALKKL